MKLIELIIKHVPRGEIHPDAKFFTQDSHTYNNRLAQFKEKPVANYDGLDGCWYSKGYIINSQINLPEIAEDARDTVITRGQLEYLWGLQDQGYMLAFGTEPTPSGTWFVENYYTLSDGIVYHAAKKSEGVITAYRPVANVSRPVVKDYAADVNAAIEKVIERNDDTDWPLLDENQFSFDVKKGYLTGTGDSLIIITRKKWDDYVSRKIRVGDKVKTQSGAVVTVLHIGEKSAFVRYGTGDELAVPLNRITRVSE